MTTGSFRFYFGEGVGDGWQGLGLGEEWATALQERETSVTKAWN